MRARLTNKLTILLTCIMFLSAVIPTFALDPLEVLIPIAIEETGSVAPGKMYEVILTAEDAANPMPVGSEAGEYILTAPKGEYTIPITFTEVGYYYYKIKQNPVKDPLCNCSSREYRVTVFISYAEDGTLESTVVMKDIELLDKQDRALFENHWKAVGQWAPEVSKILDGRALVADEFSFTLSDEAGIIQTKKNNAEGKVIFDEITFYQAGVYDYVITEIKGDAYGVTYDETVHKINLIVKDNGDGTLAFDVSSDEKGIVFKNRFDLPKTEVTVTKKWVGGPAQKPAIHIQLLRDGKPFGDKIKLLDTTTYTWKNLDKTDVDGREYKYTVEEVTVPNSYKVSYSDDTLTITNTWNKKELPSTGVGSNLPLLATGIGLLVITAYLGIKHKREH